MTTSDARRDCVLYLSDVHGEFDTLSYLLGPWRDDLRWTHLIGDVYDRGPAPDKIIDMLMDYPDADIQWGNHDVVWMGAALGQEGCIAHVVRNCARYGNLDILTNSYGIDLRPLASFALSAYADDPCEAFALKSNPGLSPADLEMNMKIQKTMAILQFKVEAALIDKYPSFGLESRKLLHLIDYDARTVDVDGVTYELTDDHFPTVDPDDPYRLTEEERAVMDYLVRAFRECDKLARHVRFLLEHGSLYKICDGDLLLHACVPLDDDGRLMQRQETLRRGATLGAQGLRVRRPSRTRAGTRPHLVPVARTGLATVRQEQDGDLRDLPLQGQGGAQGGQERLLPATRRGRALRAHLRGLRARPRTRPHYLRTCAGQGQGR